MWRRLFRGVFIAMTLLAFVLGTAFWWLGRETSLQSLVQKIADASGGAVQVSGVSGSLYGAMHIQQLSYRNPQRRISASQVDIQWSPWQLLTAGVAIHRLHVAALTLEELAPSNEKTTLPRTLALPIKVALDNVELDKITLANTAQPNNHLVLNHVRFGLVADAHLLRLQDAAIDTPWGKWSASASLAANQPFAIKGETSLMSSLGKVDAKISGTLAEMTIAATGDMQQPQIKPSTKPSTQQSNKSAKTSKTTKTTKTSKTTAVTATLQVMPFDSVWLRSFTAHARGINPAQSKGDWPQASLNLDASVAVAPDHSIQGALSLLNQGSPASLDQQGLPLRSVHAKLGGTFTALQISDLVIDLGTAGKLLGDAQITGGKVASTLRTMGNQGINLHALHGRLPSSKIVGEIVLSHQGETQHARAALKQADIQLELDASLTAGLLDVRTAHARIGKSEASVQGKINLNDRRTVNLAGKFKRLNLADWGAYPRSNLQGTFNADGMLDQNWRMALQLQLQPSMLLDAPLSGRAKWSMDARRISDADIDVQLAENKLTLRGGFGAPNDQLAWRIAAPNLGLLGKQFSGTVQGNGTLAGSREDIQLDYVLDVNALKLFDQYKIQNLHASGHLQSGENSPLQTTLHIKEASMPGVQLHALQLQGKGTRAAHTLQLDMRSDDVDATSTVTGSWRTEQGWEGSIRTLQNRGRHAFGLQAPALLRINKEQFSLSNATLKLPEGSITVQALEKNGSRLQSKGSATGVPLQYVMQFMPGLKANVSGNLMLGANWDVDSEQALNGKLRVFRERGDVTLQADSSLVPQIKTQTGTSLTLGMSALEARVDVVNNAVQAQFDLRGSGIGDTHVEASTELTQLVDEGGKGGKWQLPATSPLRLNGSINMPSLAWLARLSGQPGIVMDGKVALKVTGSGTFAAPQLQGELRADELSGAWLNEGLKLHNGQLRAEWRGDQLVLQSLRFDGEEGSASAQGWLRFADVQPVMQLQLKLDKLRVLARPDRLLVLSGQSQINLEKKRWQVDGKLTADRANIELSDQETPTISDDVVVLRKNAKNSKDTKDSKNKKATTLAAKPTAMPLQIDMELNLGERFYLKGKGLDAQLGGSLHISKSGDNRMPRAIGTIQVVKGSYAAYGQKLLIDRGLINFTGQWDNPGLNILALRKKLDPERTDGTVEAGVEVRGTALAPIAKLVSTPVVPDSEKLAWLVLGHGTQGVGGQEADLLATAAGALFGGAALQGRIANSLKLDEFGLSRAKGLESTVLTLGKRISSRAYLSYEQGAGSASSLVKLHYLLSSRLSLQAQTGASSAWDLLYTWAFD